MVTRTARKRGFLGAAALAAFAALGVHLAGCSRGDAPAPQAADPAAPESYMKDKAFRAKLDGQVAKRRELAGARSRIVERMTEMIEAKKRELGTDDLEKVKAALEKDPVWNELHARCTDANTAIDENGRKTMAMVRDAVRGSARGGKGAK